ncbi:transcriptional regulator [Rhizobium leguminosarum]|uniref:transcriptional regulator n=1 Tax=Rhizobium leguminosarum TaxID=384 RepID=UPI001C941A9B|nr:transcriptional regulator [Rhizobium leguminosarum]MBY5533674.1 transcriptional regulator [Rhizobium leguminosarum]
MKKPQRSFAVEYKSSRRKAGFKSNSIWGNLDLKSVAQDLHDEAVPFVPVGAPDSGADPTVSFPGEEDTKLLALRIEQQSTGSASEESEITDESDTVTDANVPATAAPEVVKKQRNPRAKKADADTGATEIADDLAVVADGAVGKQRRGRKAKADGRESTSKRVPVKRNRKAGRAAPSTATNDEVEELSQLEEENRSLRKLLAEKLRAENAYLRKRLNLS